MPPFLQKFFPHIQEQMEADKQLRALGLEANNPYCKRLCLLDLSMAWKRLRMQDKLQAHCSHMLASRSSYSQRKEMDELALSTCLQLAYAFMVYCIPTGKSVWKVRSMLYTWAAVKT